MVQPNKKKESEEDQEVVPESAPPESAMPQAKVQAVPQGAVQSEPPEDHMTPAMPEVNEYHGEEQWC